MNLIPNNAGITPGYWCTWGLQNYLAATGAQSNAFGSTGHSLISHELTEANIKNHAFDPDFLTPIRKDLYVLFDLGWDVPCDTNFDGKNWLLGSFEVSDNFPSYGDDPIDRLRNLNEFTKRAGWKGAGIWVPAQAFGEGEDDRSFTVEEQKDFFRERMQWSEKAGIHYWKVDYGKHAHNLDFRKMLTELGKETTPGLIIEHARNCGPLNDVECPWDTPNVKGSGLFKEWDDGKILQKSVEVVQFSDVFRTYDVAVSLTIPSTLDRVVELLSAYSETGNPCLLNCESEPFIGAVLGCAIGVMSTIYQNNILIEKVTPKKNYMLDQFIRAIRWQRIAPAWGVGIGKSRLDTNYLVDTWDFRKGSDWVDYLDEKIIKQQAPARVSRGMELPNVNISEGEVPYIICSKHPEGAFSVASLSRINTERGRYYPKVSIELDVSSDYPVGIFGKYESVTLKMQSPLMENQAIWAQDLMKDEAINITNKINFIGNNLTITGELLEELCNTTEDIDDVPGIIVVII